MTVTHKIGSLASFFLSVALSIKMHVLGVHDDSIYSNSPLSRKRITRNAFQKNNSRVIVFIYDNLILHLHTTFLTAFVLPLCHSNSFVFAASSIRPHLIHCHRPAL